MKNANIYCLSLYNNLYKKIKDLKYIPVGLGKDNFSDLWLRDNTGDNISNKNQFYAEYTFHYWFWKNEIAKLPDDIWIGFCTYRRFWKNSKDNNNNNTNSENFSEKVIQEIPLEWNNYDTILGDHIELKFKLMKILKYGKKALIKNPKAIFFKKIET